MTPAEFAALVSTAQRLIAASDRNDEISKARLSGWREGHAAGLAEGERLGAKAALEGLAEERRDIAQAAGKALKRAEERAEAEALRYHVCCRRCRREGHQRGCTRCEDRTRDTYGNPHPDDYLGKDAQPTPGRAAA